MQGAPFQKKQTMLRARRNSNLAESLGPPLRFTDIEVSRTVEEKVVHRPSASSRRPPISVTRANQGKENKLRETPCGRGKPPTGGNRQTPNSTYPASLGGNSGSTKKAINIGGQTPSSTFPVSLPITASSSQEAGITEPDSISLAAETHKNGTPSVGEEKHNNPKHQIADAETNNQGSALPAREETHVNPKHQPTTADAEANNQGGTLTSREELPSSMSYQSVVHRSNSIPKHLGSAVNHNGTDEGRLSTQRDVLPSKLNLDQATNKRGSGDAGIPVPLPSVAPSSQTFEQDPNVVTMVSTAGEKRFKRLKLLGCGGSSKVFKVVGEEDYQTYALKEVYLKHVDPAIKSAYVNEIKLLKKLSDKPEIITLYDYTFNKQEGVLYLLLEYAEMDLNAVLKSHTTANRMATVLYFWNQMLEVVKVIHNEGVIHNDLKPENFVCIGARLKLIDFGIANRIEAEKTSIERDIRCGTINYMAPETIEANDVLDCFKVGRPSDIWSLGCILYQMVYGRTPFQHIKNKLKKWQTITDPSIEIPLPQISNQDAVDVIKRCLNRNPKERPTIDELLCHPFSTMDHR